MTLEQAIKQLEKEYEKAMQLKFVHEPVAYALYKAWRYVDSKAKKQHPNGKRDEEGE